MLLAEALEAMDVGRPVKDLLRPSMNRQDVLELSRVEAAGGRARGELVIA